MEDNYKSYNVINIAPPKLDDLQEVITHCEFHPADSSLFLASSSKGYFTLCDLRMNTSYQNFGTKYSTIDEEGRKNYFSEIVNSCTWASFANSCDAFQVASRDYLFVKLWDLRRQDKAVQTFKVADYLDKDLKASYENDCIFDRFDVKCSPSNQYLSTGAYNDAFHVLDVHLKRNLTLKANTD